jgi:hypothetical protein
MRFNAVAPAAGMHVDSADAVASAVVALADDTIAGECNLCDCADM